MGRYVHKYLKKILVIITGIVLITLVIVLYRDSLNNYETNLEKMMDKAEFFNEKGKTVRAITQIQMYLDNRKDDVRAWERLGEMYEILGEEEKADEAYVSGTLVNSKKLNGGGYLLSAVNPSLRIEEKISSASIRVDIDVKKTKNMILSIDNGGLFPVIEPEDILLMNNNPDKYEISEWFPIIKGDNNDQTSYITITGGFNYAKWEFADSEKRLLKTVQSKKQYRNSKSSSISNRHIATVEVPEKASFGRVTYIKYEELENSGPMEEPVYIVYGRIPYIPQETGHMELSLPDLNEGDYLIFENNLWYHCKENEKEIIPSLQPALLYENSVISISGSVCGTLSITFSEVAPETIDDAEYGVRWLADGTSILCERVGDAVGLNFNFMIGDSWAGVYKNDFDDIYPWSEIKLCAIDNRETITYQSDPSFTLDGTCGDVMVEIPIHYIKREFIDGYEYIWISGVPKEGYVLDPSFMTPEGVVDHIYVAAYLSGISEEQTNINSVTSENPLIKLSKKDIQSFITQKGHHWKEMDISSLMTIQRLWLVETAIKDTQSIFKGNTGLVWGNNNKNDYSIYAKTTLEQSSNTIELTDNWSSKRFAVGDSVTILQVTGDTSYYSSLEEYENTSSWNREITEIKRNTSGVLELSFSGDPVPIVQSQTMIMHLPRKNGQTDSIAYHTGTLPEQENAEGVTSFRYRYMENLWGNVCVLLDDVIVKNGEVSVTYPNRVIEVLSYKLPEQKGTPSIDIETDKCSILSMGYDPGNPTIMLPSVIGNGASAVSGFGDAWFYEDKGFEYCLTYGLTWDLRQYAGLFAYRANVTDSNAIIENGSRLIYR